MVQETGAPRVSAGPESGITGRTAFLAVGVAAVIASVVQIGLGGVVRVTDSGLGCPDWPLCHGQVIPPFEFHTLIEYSHRLSASILGVVVLVSMIIVWRSFRVDALVVWTTTAALALVVVAGGLGGVAVLTELEWWVVLLHLTIAETVTALMIVATLAVWQSGQPDSEQRVSGSGGGRFTKLVVLSMAGTFVVLLSGSYMVGQGYGATCITWPLCQGDVLPTAEPQLVHMAHRFLTAIVGLILAATVVAAWPHRAAGPQLRWAAALVAAVFLLQVFLGALTVWTVFATALKALHLVGATLLWASVILLAGLTFVPGRVAYGRVLAGRARSPELEAVTP